MKKLLVFLCAILCFTVCLSTLASGASMQGICNAANPGLGDAFDGLSVVLDPENDGMGLGDEVIPRNSFSNYLAFKEQIGKMRIKYTITNTSKYTIRIVFLRTGNTDTLAPGQTKSCSSPLGTKVKAHAPNGKNWLRTISTRGGEYYIVERPGNKGIKIVP